MLWLTTINSGWMINFICLTVIPTKNLIFCILFNCIHFLKFNSSINLSFFGSPRNERLPYINDFNWSWSTKSSHSRADILYFLFVRSKRVPSFVFVLSGGYYCCFDEYVHTFTSSFILSIRLFLLHFRIPISSSSMFLYLVSSFTFPKSPFIPHLGDLISSSSILFHLILRLYYQNHFFSYPCAFQHLRGATAERQRSNIRSTEEPQHSHSGATAEPQRSDSGLTAERQRSDSRATVDQHQSDSWATAERQLSDR